MKDVPATFWLIVLARAVALFGVQLSTFAIGAWTFELHGRTTDYALLMAIGVLPALLTLPWAGSLTDRLGYHRVLPAIALADALTAGGVFALAAAGLFSPAWAWAAAFLLGLSGAFLLPAQQSLVRHLLPAARWGQAGGGLQLAVALTLLLGPAAAGPLVARHGFVFVLGVDAALATAAGLVVLAALARLPAPPPPAPDAADAGGWRVGWHATIADRRLAAALAAQLLGLTAFHALRVLTAPFVLARADEATLGLVLAGAGAGMLVASGGVAVWGADQARPGRAIMVANLTIGLVCVACGAAAGIPALAAGAFLVSLAAIAGLIHVDLLAQQVLPLAVQGRAAAIRGFLGNAGYLLAALALGPLVDRLLTPIPVIWAALGVLVLAGTVLLGRRLR